MRRLAKLGWFVWLLAWVAAPAPSAGDEPADIEFFERKIRPVLVDECYSCHSSEAKKVRGGLLLDTREGLLKGGDSGPSVVPGKPEESPLLEALRHEGLEMPPEGKLPDAVVADFERWVTMGAPDPARRAGRGGGGGHRPGGRAPVLGLPAAPPPRAARGDRRRLAAERDRPVRPGRAGGEGPQAGARRRQGHARSPALFRPHRPAADARGGRRVRRRHDAGGLRGARGSPAGLAPLRRALGPPLARRGPLRRVADAPRLRPRGGLAVPRLRDRRVQRRPALRPLRPRAGRRRPAARGEPRRATGGS